MLPFANLSGDPEQDYFADGLTDDLTTDLSHIADSFVIGRSTAGDLQGRSRSTSSSSGATSAFATRSKAACRRVGDAITVNAQLVVDRDRRASVGRPVRGRARQARRVAGRGGFPHRQRARRPAHQRRGAARDRASGRRTRTRPTYVMRGSAAWWRGYTPNSFAEAIDDYNKALRLDPTNEQALARKATVEVIGLLDLGIGRERFDEVIWEAEAEIDRAIALQPNDPLARQHQGRDRTGNRPL